MTAPATPETQINSFNDLYRHAVASGWNFERTKRYAKSRFGRIRQGIKAFRQAYEDEQLRQQQP